MPVDGGAVMIRQLVDHSDVQKISPVCLNEGTGISSVNQHARDIVTIRGAPLVCEYQRVLQLVSLEILHARVRNHLLRFARVWPSTLIVRCDIEARAPTLSVCCAMYTFR